MIKFLQLKKTTNEKKKGKHYIYIYIYKHYWLFDPKYFFFIKILYILIFLTCFYTKGNYVEKS
jgi:hypothetical protein